ncbi:MAG: phospholipid carrier-dependent glycosyltransferase [Candidatus Omnitrophota bacterium]|jgi:hypothetical protein|nr:MAG: phospholipid carrier-dependent glycosyltransferase [Candidatus Omnitrophota bacterium]
MSDTASNDSFSSFLPHRLSRKSFFRANAILIALAVVKIAIHFWVNTFDSIFRDELYYIACGNHLDFGYVDHPPFVALVAAVSRWLFGDSLFALRSFSAAAGAGMVVFAGLLVRQLGGGRFAEGLAALCVMIVPIYLGVHGFFSMNAFDQLFWLLGAYILVLIIQKESLGLWILFGVVMGIGLMNKISILFFGCGVFVGMLLTSNRRWLLSKRIWIAVAIAFLIFLPHILWQIVHGWPTLEFIRNASQYKNLPLAPMEFLLSQILEIHPFLFPIWLAGLGWYLFSRAGKPFRLLGWIYITAVVILIVNKGKSYYLAPAYAMLFASGAIVIEHGIHRWGWNWLKPVLCLILIVGGIITAPMTLPILAPESFSAYSQAIGISPSAGERHEMGALPQLFADRYGWEEMAAVVASVYQTLTPEEQATCIIVAGNYGEAGAIDYFGKPYGLPNAICGHNSYYFWRPENLVFETAIVFGFSEENVRLFAEEVTPVAMIHHEYAMPYESDLPVFLCRKIRSVDWSALKSFI